MCYRGFKKFKHHYRLLKDARGYTIAELVVVIVIIGIFSGAVTISVGDINSKVRLSNAATRALADIQRLQEIAMTEHRNVSLTINSGSNSYTITVDGVTEVVEFDQGEYVGVTISSSDLGGGTLTFSSTGQPLIGGSGFSNVRTLMMLNTDEAELIVYGLSGLITLDEISSMGGCGGC